MSIILVIAAIVALSVKEYVPPQHEIAIGVLVLAGIVLVIEVAVFAGVLFGGNKVRKDIRRGGRGFWD